MKVKEIIIRICEGCLKAEGRMCDTPECALFLHRVDLPIHEEMYQVVGEFESDMESGKIGQLLDIKDMPNFNPVAGSRGIASVTTGKVYWTMKNKVTCKVHGAMNKVSQEGIWRCIACGEGAYLSKKTLENK